MVNVYQRVFMKERLRPTFVVAYGLFPSSENHLAYAALFSLVNSVTRVIWTHMQCDAQDC